MAHRFLLFAGLLALAACDRVLETDQARLCRMAAPALSGFVRIDTQNEDADGRGVVIGYQGHSLHCRFHHPGRPLHSTEVESVALDGRALSEPRLFFLIRFWLATPEGRAADPAPLGRLEDLPRLSAPAAYALQQMLDALSSLAVNALLACSYALIYGLIGRINFAFGALAAAGGCGAALGATMALGAPPGLTLALAAALAICAALGWGLASAKFAIAPLLEASPQRLLVASVGLLIAMSEALRLAEGPRALWVAPILNQPQAIARADDFVVATSQAALLAGACALALAAGLVGLMRLSRFGRAWRAYADDAKAAAMFGIDPQAIFLQTFALASVYAGCAGTIATLSWGAVGYGAALGLGLQALTAAVLGGIGSVEGALLGAVVLTGFETLWTGYGPAAYRDAAAYAGLALTLALRPGGFLGAKS